MERTKPRKTIIEDVEKRRRVGLLLTKPSYTLAPCYKNVRLEHRTRLRNLLFKLVKQHNWVEASGVLSVLLKATLKETSLFNIRMKYSIAMELVRQIENDPKVYSKKVKLLYNFIWGKKINSYKNHLQKDRDVELESILSCLAQKDIDSAIQTVLRLRQQDKSDGGSDMNLQQQDNSDGGGVMDPLQQDKSDGGSVKDLQHQDKSECFSKSKLIMGLTYYEKWLSVLKRELQNCNVDLGSMTLESDIDENNSCGFGQDMKGDDATSIYETCSNLQCLSETSVINDKKKISNNEEPSGTNSTLPAEHGFRSQGFYNNSGETSGNDDGSFGHHNKMHDGSYDFNIDGFQWLLPLRIPSLDFLSPYGRSLQDKYDNALKYLRLAVQSPPPVSEAALLPLIQLLLLGDKVDEALNCLDTSCNKSSSVLPFRLRAHIWECFASNHDKLSDNHENALKKDPTYMPSLARLVDLHRKGYYASDRLIEMIALHLEATYGDNDVWEEFALCLLKLSHCEEDRTSICVNGMQVDEQIHTIPSIRIPVMLVEGMSGKTWKLRCRWWLNRHFSKDILTSDMVAGNLQLMTYKAACASHLYGSKLDYVARVQEHVKEHDMTLSTFLHRHIQNSSACFAKLVRN